MTQEEWASEMKREEFIAALREATSTHPWRTVARDIALVVSMVSLVGVGVTLGRTSGKLVALSDAIAHHEGETAEVCSAQKANVDVQLQDIRRRLDLLERHVRP